MTLRATMILWLFVTGCRDWSQLYRNQHQPDLAIEPAADLLGTEDLGTGDLGTGDLAAGDLANRAPEISVSCTTVNLGQSSTINIEPIDYDGYIVSAYWDLGDGTIRDDQSFVWSLEHALTDHTYGAAGTYTVTVTATDNGGLSVLGTIPCYVN